MKVRDIMTPDPASCTRDTSLREVAQLMVDSDCGEIPVVNGDDTKAPVGVITDRDITCRTVAQGINPLEKTAGEIMSSPSVTVLADASVEECCNLMEEHQIRRVPVIDKQGRLCGVVAQADIARHAPERETAQVVAEVSQATGRPSR